jgi:hypothetical protein
MSSPSPLMGASIRRIIGHLASRDGGDFDIRTSVVSHPSITPTQPSSIEGEGLSGFNKTLELSGATCQKLTIN